MATARSGAAEPRRLEGEKEAGISPVRKGSRQDRGSQLVGAGILADCRYIGNNAPSTGRVTCLEVAIFSID
jgi:hypothetical protein